MTEEDLFIFIGGRYASDEEAEFNVSIIFVWYDTTAKEYIEILANESGSQWGQPAHVMKLNLPYLSAWLEEEDEEE
jgi:hypothetical protein